jgi:hypothetical protein
MQSTSFASQDTNPVATLLAQRPATPTLCYRGVTYEGPQQRVNGEEQTQDQLAQLGGRWLSYRGSTYAMGPAASRSSVVVSTMHRLMYRGTTYLKAA